METTLDDDLIYDAQPEARYTYAGFWIRVGAAIIDGLILAPLGWLDSIQQSTINIPIISVIVLFLNVLYKPVLEATRQATFGKQLLNMKVVRTDLEPIGFPEAIIRYVPWMVITFGVYGFGYYYGLDVADSDNFATAIEQNPDSLMGYFGAIALCSLFYFVSVIVVAFNKKKQGLHDMMAKTFVVIKKS